MIPVFIGGCSRSGTHMIGAMLGAHSRCISPPECTFKFNVLHAEQRSDDDDAHLKRMLLGLMRTQSFANWQFDLDADEVPLDTMDGSPRVLLEWIVRRYAEFVGKSEADIWIDHTPTNTRYLITLTKIFPESKVIHLVRDGRAVASSVLPLDWGPNSAPRAGFWWVESVSYGLAAESMLPPDRIIRVRYEDIVQDPDRMIEKLCAFIGVQPQSDMTSDVGYRTPSHLRKTHALVGKRPDPTRINQWEQKLTERQIEMFEAYSCQMLSYLGYEMKYGVYARRMTRSESLGIFLTEACRSFLTNRIRLRRRLAVYNRTPKPEKRPAISP